MMNPEKIFLLGFMGSGKSTLGKKLAKQLGVAFFDLDDEIVKQEDCSIEQIFSSKGETYFREVEQQVLKGLVNSDKKYVLALGGGTPCFYDNMEVLNQSGISIYIKYNAGILSSRLLEAKTVRPLIKGKNKEELIAFIGETLKKREIFYSKSNYIVENNNIKVEDLIKLF